jgi:SAM-dependent MidA family methyltransferase
MAESLRYDIPIRPLTITLGDDLSGDTISHISISSIMMIHVDAAAGSQRQRLQQFQVDLRMMSVHKEKGDQCPAAKMFANEAIDSVTILESIKQRGEALGLIVQRKHRLVHKREGGAAHFDQNSSLGDPILEYCQLHRF